MLFKLIPVLLFLFQPIAEPQLSKISIESIKEAEIERYSAIIKADTTTLERFLAEDFVYHQPTGNVASKREYLQNTKMGNPKITAAELITNEVTIYEKVAISRGSVQLKVVQNQTPSEVTLLFLNVWMLRDSQLQLVARQSTFL